LFMIKGDALGQVLPNGDAALYRNFKV